MPKNLGPKNIEELMAEADELIRQINSNAIKDTEESHRLQFEEHTQNFKKIKSEVQGNTEKNGKSIISANVGGMHEAIQDIVKAMRNLTKHLT